MKRIYDLPGIVRNVQLLRRPIRTKKNLTTCGLTLYFCRVKLMAQTTATFTRRGAGKGFACIEVKKDKQNPSIIIQNFKTDGAEWDITWRKRFYEKNYMDNATNGSDHGDFCLLQQQKDTNFHEA